MRTDLKLSNNQHFTLLWSSVIEEVASGDCPGRLTTCESAVVRGANQAHVLTPHFHPAAHRSPSPNDVAVFACTARFAREASGGWRGWDRAPLTSQRPVPYPRGKDGDHCGDGRARSSCDLEGALREVGPRLVAEGDRVPPFNPCEYRGCRNRLRSRTSFQPYRERDREIYQGAVPLALVD